MKRKKTLYGRYPPSPPCSCEICRNYCSRPGWWTVEEAAMVIAAGYAKRMMLEISPEMDFAVLSPAFKGCESKIALNLYASNGCNFYRDGLCELHETSFIPLECRFCHHERVGRGDQCHLDIEKDWHTEKGHLLVKKWIETVGLF